MVINDNLFSVSENLFSPDIVKKVSDLIGQSVDKTKAGLKSVIPALLSGIVDKGSTQEGAARLVDIVNTHNFESSNKPDESKLSEGNEVVKDIFGNNLNSVVSDLGSSTGLNSSSISKLLGLSAPVLMGAIGLKVKNQKLSSSGLMNFLGQEKNTLAGFSSRVTDYSNIVGNKAMARQKELTQNVPWIKISLAALVLFGLWVWWLGTREKVVAPVVTITQPVRSIPVNMVSSSLNELSAFMAAGTIAELPRRFRFDKLSFETGTTTLVLGAEVELDKIVTALNQYPLATARLEGFTDNVGNELSNTLLSAERANAVKAELVARGIDGNRIQTVGLGSSRPIGDNATVEGRAQNRRIEFVVTNIR